MNVWSRSLARLSPFISRLAPSSHENASTTDRQDLTEEEIRLLIQFMSEIGAAMNGAGDATTFIRRSLQRIARAYGLRHVEVFVVPTLLLLRYGNDRSTFVDLSSRIPTDLRLDQIAALYDLVDDAEATRPPPVEGIVRLRAILRQPARFRAPARILALMLITGGIVLLLRPSWEEIALSLGLAFVVGAIKEGGSRWPALWPLVPAVAGLVVGSIALLAIEHGLDCRPLQVLIPPLTIFLPGAALTVSMIELANGDIVAGGSRLAYGATRLFLLVFGLIVAASWTGIPSSTSPNLIELTPLVPLVGLVAFSAGVFLHFSAPRGSFGWLLLVIAAAWIGQQIGSIVLGAYPGGFVGGATMIVVASLIQERPGAPPLIVSFTPAFWLLVPGAIGLEGLTQIVGQSPESGIDEVVAMFITMIAIALGVVFGLVISGSRRSLEPSEGVPTDH